MALGTAVAIASSIGGLGGLAAGAGFFAGAVAPAVATGLGIAAAGKALLSKPKQLSLPSPASPAPLPQAPTVQGAATRAESIIRKRKSLATKTRFTGPLGPEEEANVARKTALGA